MRVPPPEEAQLKTPALVWFFNLILIGFGNFYAGGSGKGLWCLIACSFLSFWICHWWWLWPIAYLIASTVGHGAVTTYNNGVLDSRGPRGASGLTGDVGSKAASRSRIGSDSERSGQSPLITVDFQRKIEEAERQLQGRKDNSGGKLTADDYDEQVSHWLRSDDTESRPEGSQQKPQSQPGRGQAALPGYKPDSQPAHLKRPNETKVDKIAAQPITWRAIQEGRESEGAAAGAKAGSRHERKAEMPPSYTVPAAELQATATKQPAAGKEPVEQAPLSSGDTSSFTLPADFGVTGYQSYIPGSTDAGLGLPPAQLSMPTSSFGTALGATPSVGQAEEKVKEQSVSGDQSCKRCGAPRDHDFSFCMQCGHSYAFL